MSLFNAMRTGVSGMNAQSSRISMVAENIANSSTPGYKKGSIEFETVLTNTGTLDYSSGGVASHTRYNLSQQGSLTTTSAVTDLAIRGNGFFVVSDQSGAPLLTRAGSFVPDSTGRLVNAAGYFLMGHDIKQAPDANPDMGSLRPVTMPQQTLKATASTNGAIVANLPVEAEATPAAQLPSTNAPDAVWPARTSLIAYDNVGRAVTLDIYFAKSAEDRWEASIFERSVATNGGFPYGSGPLASVPLDFDPISGRLTAPTTTTFGVPGGADATIDLSNLTQLAASFDIVESRIDGSAPVRPNRIEIGLDGVVSVVYEDGARVPSFQIPLANVVSQNQLTPVDGNAYSESFSSGPIRLGSPQQGSFGVVMSSTLENSTVDLGEELTTMIEAQRGYTANSKVFQASSDLLETLLRVG